MAGRESAAQKAEREAAEAAAGSDGEVVDDEETSVTHPDPTQQAVIDAAQAPTDQGVAQAAAAAQVTPDATDGVQKGVIDAAQASTGEAPAPPHEQQDGKLILTGLNLAMVNTSRPHPMGPTVGSHLVVEVREGQELPSDLAEGEEDRLRALGAFDEHPRDRYSRRIDALVSVGLAKRGGFPEGGVVAGGQDDDGEGPGPEDGDDGDDADDFDADTDHQS